MGCRPVRACAHAMVAVWGERGGRVLTSSSIKWDRIFSTTYLCCLLAIEEEAPKSGSAAVLVFLEVLVLFLAFILIASAPVCGTLAVDIVHDVVLLKVVLFHFCILDGFLVAGYMSLSIRVFVVTDSCMLAVSRLSPAAAPRQHWRRNGKPQWACASH